MDSGLECESFLKEVAGDGGVWGSELWIGWFAFDKHIYVCIACDLQELASSGRGGLPGSVQLKISKYQNRQ